MADRPGASSKNVNKVEINGRTVIDLTRDTVTPETLKKGVTAHSASGEKITGTAEEDLSLGMSSVAVGDFIRVKSVDTNGKPTSWEPVQAEEAETVDVDLLPAVTAEDNGKVLQVVEGAWQAKDMSSGGSGDTWELITSGEMAEAASLLITTDADGAALALKSAQIIVEGATSFTKATSLRFEVDNVTDNKNSEEWAVECYGDGKNDNPNICAVYIAEQNKIPTLYAEIPMSGSSWGSNALKVQAAKKKTKVDAVSTYSFDPLTVAINRIYVGNYMGNGKLGAGCKYQIWGIRA